jgi:hypothetical protein
MIYYHYTDINAFINILRYNQIVMRATNCFYLNDQSEIKKGIQIAKDKFNINFEEKIYNDIYLTSFSKEVDSNVAMWNTYGKDSTGIAIGFDSDLLDKGYNGMCVCDYGEDKIVESFNTFGDLILHGALSNLGNGSTIHQGGDEQFRQQFYKLFLLTGCIAAKDKSFEYENEVRYYVEVQDNSCIKYRTKNGYIVPFVEIGLSKDAIKKVIISPMCHDDFIIKSVENFLELNHYDLNAISIEKSKCPYRG